MVTIREVIDLLTKIFETLMEFFGPLFEKKEDESAEGETTEA